MFSLFRKKKATPSPDPALVAEMKEVWFRYGGSSFVIWHEDAEAAKRFHNAHIPDETIEEWRQEMIQAEFSALTEGDPHRRWIVTHHLIELIGGAKTHTDEHASRLLDLLYRMADGLDKQQRILILQRFADSNVSRDNGAIRMLHNRTTLTPRMTEVLHKLADFPVSEADNRPDSPGWTDVPGRYAETLDGIRDAYARHLQMPF